MLKASPVGTTFVEEINGNTNINGSGNNPLNPIIYLLINLSDTESELLDKYLRERKYASLKELIDHKREEVSHIFHVLGSILVA